MVITGRVVRADGTPAARAPVVLEREPTFGDAIGGSLFVPLTFFTACLADPPPELCRGRRVRRTTTTADGTYSFELTGRDTQDFFGTASSFSLSAEAGAAAVTAGFKVQTENLRLPDLQTWEPRVTVGAGRIGWDARDGTTAYQVAVEDNAGQPVWSFDTRSPEVTFDPRILEDTAGTLAVSVRDRTTAEGTTVAILRRSGRVEYRSTAGPPVSRGKPCGVSPCPLTDGDFTTRLPQPATTTSTTAPPPPASATIDLGQPRDVSLVVVRGCSCQVDGSTDGQLWTALGRSTGSTAVVPARTSPSRYVRLTGFLADLGEVSVWEGSAPAVSTTADSPPVAPGRVAPSAPDPSRTAPALLALAALLAAAIGTAAVTISRRRPDPDRS